MYNSRWPFSQRGIYRAVNWCLVQPGRFTPRQFYWINFLAHRRYYFAITVAGLFVTLIKRAKKQQAEEFKYDILIFVQFALISVFRKRLMNWYKDRRWEGGNGNSGGEGEGGGHGGITLFAMAADDQVSNLQGPPRGPSLT